MNDPKSPEAAFRAAVAEDVRPWGRFRRFPHEGVSSVKIITVAPGGRLSLQYHRRRSEFWVALDDGLEVTVGDRVWPAASGEEIFIAAGARHRVRNTGTAPARILELWLGPSSEEDIVRVEDDYDRR